MSFLYCFTITSDTILLDKPTDKFADRLFKVYRQHWKTPSTISIISMSSITCIDIVPLIRCLNCFLIAFVKILSMITFSFYFLFNYQDATVNRLTERVYSVETVIVPITHSSFGTFVKFLTMI